MANWYVRPDGGSYGNQNGTNWNNAYNGFSGINWNLISCGDTIWIAGGTYTTHFNVSKNCSNNSQLYIRKARSDSSECTSSPGWSPAFNSSVIQHQSGISFQAGTTSNYITISGKTTAYGGNIGWIIDYTGLTHGNGMEFENTSNTNHILIEYIEFKGPDILDYTDDCRGIDDSPYNGSSSYHTFSHLKIHGWESGIYACYYDYHVSEYIDMYDIRSSTMHPNLYYIIIANNGIIRYSKFHNSEANGTGIAFSDGGPWNNWLLYGNIFYNNPGYGCCIGIQDAPIVNLKIYNNTFDNNGMNTNFDYPCGANCETKNNIFSGNGGIVACGTSINNLTTTNKNIFVDINNSNYHIVDLISSGYPRNTGTNLSSYFTTDMDGTLFGNDGAWDIGAYEYISETCPPVIANFNLQVI